MKILAIETSTEACSAAILSGGQILERYEVAPQRHTELILPMIDALMAASELPFGSLDGLAFGCGPGSFTGVRIASSVIQALAFAHDLPVAPVSTLAALSYQALSVTDYSGALAAIDARMNEVYWGCYRAGNDRIPELLGTEQVSSPAALRVPDSFSGLGVGSGWDRYQSTLQAQLQGSVLSVMADQFPRAAAVAQLGLAVFQSGLGVPAEAAQPVYLRNNVATTKS